MTLRILIPLLLVASSAAVAHESDEHDGLLAFLAGNYVLIGKHLDSDDSFVGSLVLEQHGDHLAGYRLVSTVKTDVRAVIRHPACCESTHMLRLTFELDGVNLEASYLVTSDLDNYGRLSGHVYNPAQKTNWPGMEVLFFDHRADGAE